jgi:hypothetical protein
MRYATSFLIPLGREDEAIAALRRATESDPHLTFRVAR